MLNSDNDSHQSGGSKRFSVADEQFVRAEKSNDTWGKFDEDWGFRIYDVPEEFRTKRKFENFDLAKKEESEKKLTLDSMPYQIDFEPTNICNLRCPLCSTGLDAKTRQKGTLGFTQFKKLIDEIKDTVLQLSLQNWGEPTLVKNLPKMIRYGSDCGIFIRMSTNFSVEYSEEYLESLITSGLGRLIIDVDGTTQEIYEQYRQNGNLDTVLNNTKKAVKIKKEKKLKFPIIQTRMLVMKHNEHQINDFKTISKELDVDEIELGNIQLNPNTAPEKWLPQNPEYVYATYKGERRKTPCHWPWSGLAINWDGGVSPCAIVDDQYSDFGNVFDDGLKKVWNNEYYVSARSEWSNNKKMSMTTICNICKNDTHNPNLLRVGNSFSLTLNKNISFRDNNLKK